MTQNKIDILALQETRINTDSMENHEGFTFYFSTSVAYEDRIEAEKAWGRNCLSPKNAPM